MAQSKKKRKPAQKHGKKPSQPKRKRVTYATSGRECAHADKGCCPKCLWPLGRKRSSNGGK